MSSSSRFPDPPEKPRIDPKRRSHITVACNACRIRKYKCNGDRPVCTGCQDRGTECVYDTEPDTTRSSSLKRKQAALEEEVNTLRDLVRLLRDRPQDEVDSVVRRLRSGDDVRNALIEITSDLPSSARPSNTDLPSRISNFVAESSASTRVDSQPMSSGGMEEQSPSAMQANKDRRMRIANILTDGAPDSTQSSDSRSE